MTTLAKELSTLYRQEKEKGTPKTFAELISTLYKKYKDRFGEYDTLASFKSAILKKYHSVKSTRVIRFAMTKTTANEVAPTNEDELLPSEGDGLIFTLHQIEMMDLNPESY